MESQTSIIEIMRKRHSVRTFAAKNLSDSDFNRMNNYIKDESHLIGPLLFRKRKSSSNGIVQLVPANWTKKYQAPLNIWMGPGTYHK